MVTPNEALDDARTGDTVFYDRLKRANANLYAHHTEMSMIEINTFRSGRPVDTAYAESLDAAVVALRTLKEDGEFVGDSFHASLDLPDGTVIAISAIYPPPSETP